MLICFGRSIYCQCSLIKSYITYWEIGNEKSGIVLWQVNILKTKSGFSHFQNCGCLCCRLFTFIDAFWVDFLSMWNIICKFRSKNYFISESISIHLKFLNICCRYWNNAASKIQDNDGHNQNLADSWRRTTSLWERTGSINATITTPRKPPLFNMIDDHTIAPGSGENHEDGWCRGRKSPSHARHLA